MRSRAARVPTKSRVLRALAAATRGVHGAQHKRASLLPRQSLDLKWFQNAVIIGGFHGREPFGLLPHSMNNRTAKYRIRAGGRRRDVARSRFRRIHN